MKKLLQEAKNIKHNILWGSQHGNVIRLIKKYSLKQIAEIGVWKGKLSRKILETNPEKLILVDPLSVNFLTFNDLGTQYKTTMGEDFKTQHELDEIAQSLHELPSPAEFYRMTSVDASKEVPDKSLDMVYIDGLHTYEAVKDDIRAWYPKVRTGGGCRR